MYTVTTLHERRAQQAHGRRQALSLAAGADGIGQPF